MTSALRQPPLVLLIALTALAPFALNSFLPSIPRIVDDLHTDLASAQLTLTVFLAGVAVGQLAYGPVSDRFGRRPPLLFGMALATAASALCLFAPSIEWLNTARVFQALGMCSGTVLGRAIVRDCHGRDRAAAMLGYVTMAMAVVPAVAPSIGGALDSWIGWRATFGAMFIFTGAVFVWCIFSGHETNHHRTSDIGALALLQSNLALLRNRSFLGYTFSVTLASGAFFSFLAGAPHLTITVLNLDPLHFGLGFGAVSVSYMIGNFATARLSPRLGVDVMVLLGIAVALPAALLMLALAASVGPTLLTIFVPMCGVAIGNGMSQASGIAGAVSVNPRLAGAASGLLGFLQMAGGAGASLIVGFLQDSTLFPVASAMSVAFLGALLSYLWGRAARTRKATGS